MKAGLTEALQRWYSIRKDELAEVGVSLTFVESRTAGQHVSAEDRSGYIDLQSEAMLARATVWDRGFCDLELFVILTDERLMYQHHEELSAARLTELLDDLANRTTNSK